MPDNENNSASDIVTDTKKVSTDVDISVATEKLAKLLSNTSINMFQAIEYFLNGYSIEDQRKMIAGDTKNGGIFLEIQFFNLGKGGQYEILKLFVSPFNVDGKYTEEVKKLICRPYKLGSDTAHYYCNGNILHNRFYDYEDSNMFFELLFKVVGLEKQHNLLSFENDLGSNALHILCSNARADYWNIRLFHALIKGLTMEQQAKLLLSKDNNGCNVLQTNYVQALNFENVSEDIMEYLTPKQRVEAILNQDNKGCNVLHNCDCKRMINLLNYLPIKYKIIVLAYHYIETKVATVTFFIAGTALLIPGIVLLKHPEVISPKACYALTSIGITLIAASIVLGVVLCAKSKSSVPLLKLEGCETEKVTVVDKDHHLGN